VIIWFMEFLVTMTTHVPDGTTGDEVDGVRTREGAHTRELARQGYVLRLWRPPLAPGEWRTLGLFAAADATQLERVLVSMPLRIWRTDQVQELAAHPDDPSPGPGTPEPTGTDGREFLVSFTPVAPSVSPPGEIAAAIARAAPRARELARQGHLVRLWQLPVQPGGPSVLGLWRAADQPELAAILASLPPADYLTTQVTELTPHPSDPMAPGSRPAQSPLAP
jgi:muconolactone delta-isomerase